MLPVSLNLSKLDFDLIHPLKLIEETVQKYGIPKEYIHVEITESVMAWNRETLSGLLKSFRIAGYEVWMDDFGSEYSSLNTLHNYTFDLLKIDMEFFRNFDETSRKIISSVVQMAKTLGLQTLAEGVENKDQLDFLRKIGCGKIQGYYYSRPLLYEDLVSLCQEKGLELEDERESHVYDAAGLVNTLSDTPAGLFSFDDEKMVYLSVNDGFLHLFSMGTRSDLDEINRMINAPDSPLYAKIQSLGRNAYENGTSTMVVVQREKYLKLKAEFVAGTKSWWIGKIHVTDLSTLAEVNDTRWMDHAFRTLASLYEAMYLIRPTDDEVSVCWTTSAYETGNNEYSGIRKFFIGFADEMVFPSDRKRFLQFVMPSNLLKAVENTGRIDLSSVFRIREAGNSYHWKVLQVTLMQNGKEKDILLTFREDLWERGTPDSWRLFPEFAASLQREAAVQSVDGVRDFTEEDVLYRNLFYSLIHYSDLHLYWKDRNLKTLGVSDIVARDLGVENPSSLAGTTLKDLSSYIHNDEIHQEEEEIVRTGKGRFGEKQLYMMNGVPMNMRLTEFPFYNENRQIDGLMGYSVFDERENSQPAKMMSDRETDFLDPFGTVLYGRQYDVTLRENGNDYCVLILFLREYEKLLKTIGKDNFGKVIQLISESIREENFKDVMVGRFSESSFLLFARSSAAERLLHFGERLSKKLSKKQTVGGMTLSFDLSFDIVYGSEAESFGEVLHWLYGKLYKDVRGETAGHVPHHSKILMKIAESAPESVMLIDPENYDIIYMNAAARGVLGIPENRKENAGKCYEIVHGANSPCSFCHVRTLHRTCFYNWSNVWKKPGRKFLNRDILIPWKNRYVDMHIAFDLSDYLKTELEIDRRIYQEIWTNDAIYQSFMEEDPETGIQKLLKMIGESMKAERVLIFEKNGAQTVNCMYEWRRGGVAPLLQELRGILDSHLRGLYKGFAESQVVMVQDYAKFQRENPDFKMPIAGLQNFVSGQILISGKSDGFTFVVNSDPENFDLSEVMFITLTNFVASILRYRNNMLEIEEKGLRDYLTGCYNRRGLEKYLRNRSSVGKAAFISGDINGLKRINDTLGHSAGDAAIQKVSRILMNEADRNHVFRMGGDEFLLILEDYDISAVRHTLARIKSEAHIQGLSIALGFSIHEGPVENIDEILIEADTEMYDDKGKHYHRRSTDQTGAKEQTDGDRNRV